MVFRDKYIECSFCYISGGEPEASFNGRRGESAVPERGANTRHTRSARPLSDESELYYNFSRVYNKKL